MIHSRLMLCLHDAWGLCHPGTPALVSKFHQWTNNDCGCSAYLSAMQTMQKANLTLTVSQWGTGSCPKHHGLQSDCNDSTIWSWTAWCPNRNDRKSLQLYRTVQETIAQHWYVLFFKCSAQNCASMPSKSGQTSQAMSGTSKCKYVQDSYTANHCVCNKPWILWPMHGQSKQSIHMHLWRRLQCINCWNCCISCDASSIEIFDHGIDHDVCICFGILSELHYLLICILPGNCIRKLHLPIFQLPLVDFHAVLISLCILRLSLPIFLLLFEFGIESTLVFGKHWRWGSLFHLGSYILRTIVICHVSKLCVVYST